MRAVKRPGPALAAAIAIAPVLLVLLLVGCSDRGAVAGERDARLAVLEAHRLLVQPVQGTDQAEPPSLAEVLLASTPLALGPLTFDSGLGPEVDADESLAGAARRAVARGLRTAAEAGLRPMDLGGNWLLGEDGEPLPPRPLPVDGLLAGEFEPEPDGVALHLERRDDGLRLSADLPDGRTISAHLKWQAPGLGALLPPLVAIGLAVLTRRPFVSLLLGVLVGAWLVRLAGGSGHVPALGGALWDVPAVYLWSKVGDVDKLEIVGFVVLMLAMVGNLTRNGGIQGVMERMRAMARSARSTQVSAYLMGLVVFFDDYANTVLVGSTMRPLSDRFRVAREKLAYIVDSTAAPVAGISIFSTWIAFEVSTFAGQLPAAGLSSRDGYAIFLETLPYRFYCLFTLLLVGLVVFSGRDFGPMRRAEQRARGLGQLVRPGGKPLASQDSRDLEMARGVAPRAWRALVPLLAFLGVTLFEIARIGGAFSLSLAELGSVQGLTGVLYDGSGSWPLLAGSAAGFALAAAASLGAGLRLDVLRSAWASLRSMGVALGILYSAWMIGDVCAELGTAPLLATLVEGALHPALLPAALFVLAAAIALATGSSWGTMSILLPLVVGLSFQLGQELPIGGLGLMVLSIGAVLEGAIFGDHCSPISDTTVLSSIATGSDHIDHVRTQAPYAFLTMALALLVGYLPCAFFGLHWAWALGGGALALILVVRFLFRSLPEPPALPAEAHP